MTRNLERILIGDEFALKQEWRALQLKKRDVEFERATFCRKLRGRFEPGPSGDRSFAQWCCVHLMATDTEADRMLSLAIAGSVFSDALAFSLVGGERNMPPMSGMSSSMRAGIMTDAQNQRVSIRTICMLRTTAGALKSKKPKSVRLNGERMLARFIADRLDAIGPLPPEVATLVRMHVPGLRRVDQETKNPPRMLRVE